MALDSVRPTVLITGASRGIGNELVPFFAGTGHNVVLVADQKPILEGIAAAVRNVFHVGATVIACDLAAPEAARTVFAELSQRKIDVDILVNDAGFGANGEFAAIETQTEERIIQANIVSLTMLTRLLLPRMIACGNGRILNVACAADFAPIPMHSVYGATKAYVLSFSAALSDELKGTGVTVTSLSPEPENARAYRKQTVPARAVARTGFRALIRGDRVAVPGCRDLVLSSLIA